MELVLAKFLEIVCTAHTEHSIAGVEQISLRITYLRFSGYCEIKCRKLRHVPTRHGAACFGGAGAGHSALCSESSTRWQGGALGCGALFTVTQPEKERKIYLTVELRSCKRTRLGLAPRSEPGYGLGQEAERKKVGNLHWEDWWSQGCMCKDWCRTGTVSR